MTNQVYVYLFTTMYVCLHRCMPGVRSALFCFPGGVLHRALFGMVSTLRMCTKSIALTKFSATAVFAYL